MITEGAEWVASDLSASVCPKCMLPIFVDEHTNEGGEHFRFGYHRFIEGGNCPFASKVLYQLIEEV